MLERAFVIAAHLVEIGCEAAAPDTIDDLRGGARRIRKIDRLAGPHGQEHRRERRRAIGQRGRRRGVALAFLLRVLDMRQLEDGFLGRGNHRGGAERARLRRHRAGLVVNHEQLVAGAPQLRQDVPDLLDTAGLPQIHIHDQNPMRLDLSVAGSKQAGDHFMPRLEHRADRGQLGRFIRYEVDEHFQNPAVNSGRRLAQNKFSSKNRPHILPGKATLPLSYGAVILRLRPAARRRHAGGAACIGTR